MAKKTRSVFSKVIFAAVMVSLGACVWAFFSNDIKFGADSARNTIQNQVSEELNTLSKSVKP